MASILEEEEKKKYALNSESKNNIDNGQFGLTPEQQAAMNSQPATATPATEETPIAKTIQTGKANADKGEKLKSASRSKSQSGSFSGLEDYEGKVNYADKFSDEWAKRNNLADAISALYPQEKEPVDPAEQERALQAKKSGALWADILRTIGGAWAVNNNASMPMTDGKVYDQIDAEKQRIRQNYIAQLEAVRKRNQESRNAVAQAMMNDATRKQQVWKEAVDAAKVSRSNSDSESESVGYDNEDRYGRGSSSSRTSGSGKGANVKEYGLEIGGHEVKMDKETRDRIIEKAKRVINSTPELKKMFREAWEKSRGAISEGNAGQGRTNDDDESTQTDRKSVTESKKSFDDWFKDSDDALTHVLTFINDNPTIYSSIFGKKIVDELYNKGLIDDNGVNAIGYMNDYDYRLHGYDDDHGYGNNSGVPYDPSTAYRRVGDVWIDHNRDSYGNTINEKHWIYASPQAGAQPMRMEIQKGMPTTYIDKYGRLMQINYDGVVTPVRSGNVE